MILREFSKHDYEYYEALATAFHSGPASFTEPDTEIFKRNFDYILNHDSAFGWLVEVDGYRAGYCLCSMMYSTEVGGLQLWIEELSIDASFQGRGLGTQILNKLIALFPEVMRFRLEVSPQNEQAAHLYKRLGYRFLDYRQMIYDREA